MKGCRTRLLAKQAVVGLEDTNRPWVVCYTSFSTQNVELKMPLFSAQSSQLEKNPTLLAGTAKKMQHLDT